MSRISTLSVCLCVCRSLSGPFQWLISYINIRPEWILTEYTTYIILAFLAASVYLSLSLPLYLSALLLVSLFCLSVSICSCCCLFIRLLSLYSCLSLYASCYGDISICLYIFLRWSVCLSVQMQHQSIFVCLSVCLKLPESLSACLSIVLMLHLSIPVCLKGVWIPLSQSICCSNAVVL